MGLAHRTTLFGSRRRTEVLILLALLQESYPSELARLLGAANYSIQTILDQFERDGVTVTRRVGRVRRVSLNPRFYAAEELRALLWRLGEEENELQRAAGSRRARPRRRGKPL